MNIYWQIMIFITGIGTLYTWFKYKDLYKSYQFELRQNNKLKNKNARKSQFLANMSHEIRTPLNGVLVAGQLLAEQDLSPKNREISDVINNSGKLVMNIINEILDFSKIEAGKLELDYHHFKLSNCMRDVLFSFEEQFKGKGLTLTHHIADEITEKIYSDEMRLKQILYNIIGNSFKFTKTGGVKIEINLPSEDFIEFRIADTGIGIAAKNLPHIFTPYKQESEKTQKEFGGTGLGLTISKNLVEQMGGNIKVQSKLGEGTEFIFTLKNEKVSEEIVQKTNEEEVKADYSSLNVLVADDNPTNRKVVELSLAKHKVKLDFAINGLEAVEKAQQGDFDLILMDIQMPVMNGIEASEKIVTTIPFDKLPIIFALSADVFKETKDQCFNAGMGGFLGKPINLKRLEGPLKMALDRKIKLNTAA